MGLIDRVTGASAIGEAAEGLSEVFVANATRSMELDAELAQASLQMASEEFRHAGSTWFDRGVNGLNRLPRPFLALGTLGLFTYAMVDPIGFSARMLGLQDVPEPLWWLLGAVVSFYFGAREMHYARSPARRRRSGGLFGRRRARREAEENPALSAWERLWGEGRD